MFESHGGGFSFGGFFRAACATAEFFASQKDGGAIVTVVIGPYGGQFLITGHFAGVMLLRPLLQFALGVLVARAELDRVDLIAEEVEDRLACGGEAGVEVDGADECFERIFQHRFTGLGLVLAMGVANFEVFAQLLGLCHAGK